MPGLPPEESYTRGDSNECLAWKHADIKSCCSPLERLWFYRRKTTPPRRVLAGGLYAETAARLISAGLHADQATYDDTRCAVFWLPRMDTVASFLTPHDLACQRSPIHLACGRVRPSLIAAHRQQSAPGAESALCVIHSWIIIRSNSLYSANRSSLLILFAEYGELHH